MFHRRVFFSLWAVIVLGVLVRAAVMLRGPGAFDDPDNYLPLARSLVAGDGFTWKGRPTAYRPPLYPLLLAPSIAILGNQLRLGHRALHLGLGAGTVWLTAVAAKGSGLSPARSTLAALVIACDPVLVWQSPLGDDRDAHGLLSGRGPGRAGVPGMVGASAGWSWPGAGLALPAKHARGSRANGPRRISRQTG